MVRLLILVIVVACTHSESPPAPPPPPPITNAAPTTPVVVAPTCVRDGSGFSHASVVGGVVVACYFMPRHGRDGDDCWRFDLSTHAWSFANRQPHVDAPEPPPQVTATSMRANVCRRDGSDCRGVPLSGIAVGPDDTLEGATNADRSIVAVWTRHVVHVFDAAGKRLTQVNAWPTPMSGGNGPSVFRGAHVLGNVLEVRIADTPISSAMRLYDARTGKMIADVFGGNPMDDQLEPVELGGTKYAFLTVDERSVLVVDVATGKQLSRHPIGDVTLAPVLLARVGADLAGVIATTGFVVDGKGTVSIATVPACPDQ